MVRDPARSALYLAFALSLTGISGCASDGGAGELAGMALLLAPMGGDASSLMTAAAVVGGASILAASGDDGTTPATAAAPAQAYKPDLQKLVDRESPERYRSRSCEYIEMSLQEASAYLAATQEPVLVKAGEARKAAASQVWYEKGCTQANLPRGLLGMKVEAVDPVSAARSSAPTVGVLVDAVEPGSGAARAGMLKGDIIVAVNDQPVADFAEFRVIGAKAPLGSTLNVKYWRAYTFHTSPVQVSTTGTAPPPLPLAARTATTATAVAGTSTGSASPASLQGMSLGAVTPSYAKAVGLTTAHGAWVTDTVKGGAADKAGIKPLDVIVEVGGQEVASAQDVAEISSRMRVGYKTTVSVWRDQSKRDVQMVLRNE
ncbi:PDZ domain-containing protein [Pseudomonas sp. 5P_5.1_Bac1]|uniref:PDZ domain-containing protein n=1 Tax=Pseudomonas sp. 5P_5.1_Bac1 TaxID=2971616 RepID=UPI0021CACCE7|nr:PDZ domain-containing protein [Pseudomonas sp. 5P_5.1_Bac1]MCU1724875.1 PDZ domain-containing protein [Pseudomonas sp. 5P_5.1_Bac1]